MGDMHLGIYNFFCLKLLIFRLFSFLPKDLVVVDYVLTWKQLLDFGFILNTKKQTDDSLFAMQAVSINARTKT